MHDEIFQQARTFITEHLDPAFIIVFGSYAKGTTHSESDIDIAFYREDKSFSAYELFMFAQQLADIIDIEVDLVDLKEASTVFAAQIFSTGEVIYSKNDNLRMELHMRTYSMYARLNEERQPIIDKFIETGSVFGKDFY
ncbi:type VII toxin-antitoxin system MntA family adenylyltransferase antitoxin [Sporosarcina beigongshangi]|uniref:type VII toxin-antitoxin system MntA family adenylyltransferase antitoxin n=1 Tax=Sporosarcina beigongshangi TaxID=2782538 RepID=UPI0019395786|nr:nucleotidyltransferase domain-containing protein [Sporosarcina beigongshangi]